MRRRSPPSGPRTTTPASGRSTCARVSQWQDGTPFTVGRRRRHDRPHGGRRCRPRRRHRRGRRPSTPDDLTVTLNLEKPNGNLPALVSIYNPQSLVTPADYSRRHRAQRAQRRHRSVDPRELRPTTFTASFTPNPNWWGGSVNLDSDHPAGLRQRRHQGRRDGRPRDRRRSRLLGHRRRHAAQRRQLQRVARRRRTTARSGSTPSCPRAARSPIRASVRPWPMRSTASRSSTPCTRARRSSPTTTSVHPSLPVVRRLAGAARARHRDGQAAAQRRRLPRRLRDDARRRRHRRGAADRGDRRGRTWPRSASPLRCG